MEIGILLVCMGLAIIMACLGLEFTIRMKLNVKGAYMFGIGVTLLILGIVELVSNYLAFYA